MLRTGNKILGKILFFFIYFYRLAFSPWLPRTCRFYPSCSTYALKAVQKYDFFKGSQLLIKRILKCHPGHPGGHDPVP